MTPSLLTLSARRVQARALMATPQQLARVVQVCARGFGKLGRERARAAAITPQQADALEVIDGRGVISTGALALTLGIDPSTTSRNVTGLVRAGLITRKDNADDGRQTDIRLTPKGKRVAETLSGETLRAFDAVLDRVPRGERQRVTEALAILAQAVGGGEDGGRT